MKMKLCSLAALLFFLGLIMGSCSTGVQDEATRTVAASLQTNKLGIEAGDLQSKDNPRGEGSFVYVDRTRFSGTERYIIWLVLDGNAYPLNGATKNITPFLPWPREVNAGTWSRTGLDQYIATEAIEIVFGP